MEGHCAHDVTPCSTAPQHCLTGSAGTWMCGVTESQHGVPFQLLALLHPVVMAAEHACK